jgi:hypothetical protein
MITAALIDVLTSFGQSEFVAAESSVRVMQAELC